MYDASCPRSTDVRTATESDTNRLEGNKWWQIPGCVCAEAFGISDRAGTAEVQCNRVIV